MNQSLVVANGACATNEAMASGKAFQKANHLSVKTLHQRSWSSWLYLNDKT